MQESIGSELHTLFVARSGGSLLGPAPMMASGLWLSANNRRVRCSVSGCRAGAHALEQAGGLKQCAAPACAEAAPGRCSATHTHTHSQLGQPECR
jgi:predicted naringenin-chalcone synthase